MGIEATRLTAEKSAWAKSSEPASALVGFDYLVASCSQRLDRFFQPVVLHEHIVGIEGRNCEDRNGPIREWLPERRQHSGLGKWKRAMQLEASPSIIVLNFRWHLGRVADDRQLIGCTRNGVKLSRRAPRWKSCFWRKTTHRKCSRQSGKLQTMMLHGCAKNHLP